MRDTEILFLDVETTGFSKEDEIIQIAACNGDSSFKVYITPSRPVHWRAAEATGLEFNNGHLYLRGKRVRSIPARAAFKRFMNYLRRINKDTILVAHNCFGFDMPRVVKLANELGFLNQFKKLVKGFSDSLVILRTALRHERGGKGSFTLKALMRDYLPNECTNNLHNAEYDVKMLKSLLFNSQLNISKEQVIQRSKSIDQYLQEQEIKILVLEAKKSLECYKNILSSYMINKMAKARIDKSLLINTFQNDGEEGIKRLFSENNYGRPRVTRNKKIISNLCNSLQNDLYYVF